MRRLLFALTLSAVALTAAACSADTAPGWTYAAPTEAPSAAGGGAARRATRPPRRAAARRPPRPQVAPAAPSRSPR